MRSLPFTTGGRTRSRPGLRLRYFRVGGSLPMRDHAFLAGPIMNGLGLHAALARLPHLFAELVRFARRDPDLTFPLPHPNSCAQGDTATTPHDLRDATDRDDVLDHAVALASATAAVAPPPLAAAPSAPAAATAARAPRTARRPMLLDRRRGRRRRRRRRLNGGFRRFLLFLFLFFH